MLLKMYISNADLKKKTINLKSAEKKYYGFHENIKQHDCFE